jgi:DHA1 family bicyclomycin/chloramphenicol resistance-like MFS transporter
MGSLSMVLLLVMAQSRFNAWHQEQQCAHH